MSWLIPERPLKLDIAVCNGQTFAPSRNQCRYLGDDDGKPCCLKLDSELKYIIDSEVEAFLRKDGKEYVPLGDNCPGVENDCE